MTEAELFEIDGSVLEGGGQILRNSVSLSAILGIPLRVKNIRAGRSKPGLAAQHLKGIQLVAEMCKAKLKGVQLGSTEIEFIPGIIKGGNYVADTGTAGSISLLLQVALPCAFLADGPVTLELKGGTNADMAPQIDFMTEVFRCMLRRFGADFKLTIHRRGYFPKGGGHVTVEVTPVKKFNSVTLLERGEIEKIRGWSFVAGVLPIKMAHQMADGARQQLQSECKDIDIQCYKEDRQMAPDNCNGMIITCQTSSKCVLGADALGRRGAEPRAAGARAAERLRAALRAAACVDDYVQDQIIIYMALADGISAIRTAEITLHTQTAIYIAEKIAKVRFTLPEGDQNVLECKGLGIINNNIVT